MKTNEYLKSPEYWLEKIQNDIFVELHNFKNENELNQNELALKMKVSKGYISQILNGNFNYTLRKMIELMLMIGKVPVIKFITLRQFQNNKKLIEDFFLNIASNPKSSSAYEMKLLESEQLVKKTNCTSHESRNFYEYYTENAAKDIYIDVSHSHGERISA
jgi:transcriptional regulator with XRE-family HTH domain